MRSFLLKNSKHFKCFSVQRFPIRSLSSNVLVNNDDFGGRGVVQRLKLNNPKKRNALSLAMLQELNHHFELMEKQCISPTTTSESTSKTNEEQRLLRALVISSNCEKIFSSGHDLKELAENNDRKYHQLIFDECTKLMLRMRDLPVPVICQVDGLAAAAGCQFVASCDIVLATERSHFSTPGANVGLFCSTPGIAVARSVHRRMAAYMLLTGRPINANEALISGLVTCISPSVEAMHSQFFFITESILESIIAKPASVIALGKQFLFKQLEMDNLADAYSQGSKVMVDNLSMKDCQEGIDAFLKKRQPKWTHSNE
ncbi:enoyl-coa hydratase-like protein [Dermatophagoides farinae]|uniref:Enoyl-CoA hydratase domain-containing protein 3, mitochondrial n=1 Tax=Dermatophagoides farinae TaxID=6954 RepID=A0A9D4NSG8_DERFA|nr:enoyl-coa hydratase-like protein [Dermatophagoides farinae]